MLKSRKTNIKVEFETTAKEYSLADFYISYQDILPQVVLVTRGYGGDSTCSTVLKENQILFINAISRKSRVLARCQSTRRQLLLGIPATQKVCLVERGRCEKESYLFDILNQHTLPLTVQFPKEYDMERGRHNEEPDMPLLHLTKMYDEVHLLGNFVGNQQDVCSLQSVRQLSSDIVYIPLHLADVRLSIVTGIAKQSSKVWHHILGELKESCAELEYDMLFGQTDIAEFVPDISNVGKTYSYIQPRSYVSTARLMAATPLEEKDHKYEETEEAEESVYDTIICPPDPSLPQRNIECGYLNTPLHKNDKEDASQANIQTMSNMMQDCKGLSMRTYVNEVPRNEVQPFSSQQQIPENENNNIPNNDIESSENEHNVKSEKRTPMMSSTNVATLTISEIGEYLMKLNLTKYIEKFRDERVDGAILIEIDRDVLKSEFGLSTIEAIRLYKFAQEGHVPLL